MKSAGNTPSPALPPYEDINLVGVFDVDDDEFERRAGQARG
jgi:hypothetical protein